MEANELKYLKAYAHRINDAGGDPHTLSDAEHQHLTKLLRKYQLEKDLADIEEKLGQARLL